jgi:protein O-GlcNAc transferase
MIRITLLAVSFLALMVTGCDTSPEPQGAQLLSRQVARVVPSSTERRAISMGLYGSTPKYTVGAVRNVELASKIYPGWKVYVYLDPTTVPQDIIKQLEARGAVIRANPAHANMFARFLIADEPEVDRFIVRDPDSRISQREKDAVDEWMASGFMMHNMRDHPNHREPVMGGLWGAVKGFIGSHKMSDLIRDFSATPRYNHDQEFLAFTLKTLIGESNMLSHDSYHCTEYPNSIPFPTERNQQDHFVGQYVTENEEFLMKFGGKSPLACRKNLFWRP